MLDHFNLVYIFFPALGPIQRPHIQISDGHMSCMLTFSLGLFFLMLPLMKFNELLVFMVVLPTTIHVRY